MAKRLAWSCGALLPAKGRARRRMDLGGFLPAAPGCEMPGRPSWPRPSGDIRSDQWSRGLLSTRLRASIGIYSMGRRRARVCVVGTDEAPGYATREIFDAGDGRDQ